MFILMLYYKHLNILSVKKYINYANILAYGASTLILSSKAKEVL